MADFSGDFSVSYAEPFGSCTIRFRCFDTPNSVTLYGCAAPDRDAEALLLSVRERCLELHRLWSFSLPGSDVSRVNAAAGRVEVDASTARLLQAMGDFHEAEPAFDFTVGPVSYLWKHASAVPSDAEIREALTHVGAEKVAIDGCTVVKRDPLVRIDVGGAAKGFAADEVAAMLRAAGAGSADVDLGGNLYMLGAHPSARPWRVAVRVPDGAGPILEVEDRSVVTSGNYERSVEIGGVRYGHIIDARTGRPAEGGPYSVTVVSPSSLLADMLATTAMLVDSDELRARHPEAEFTVISGDESGLAPRRTTG